MKRIFDIAMTASKKSTYFHKLGAVIVKKGKILSVGFNKPHKTHPRSNTLFKTIHAEFDAILQCDERDLKGATIYVLRNAKSGLHMAKPCSCCMELIRRVGIKRIIYTVKGGLEEINV